MNTDPVIVRRISKSWTVFFPCSVKISRTIYSVLYNLVKIEKKKIQVKLMFNESKFKKRQWRMKTGENIYDIRHCITYFWHRWRLSKRKENVIILTVQPPLSVVISQKTFFLFDLFGKMVYIPSRFLVLGWFLKISEQSTDSDSLLTKR